MLLLAILVAPLAAGLDFPQKPAARVNDYAHLLSPDEVRYLESKLAAWDQASSNQLVIATFESLEGEALDDISIRIAEAWRPGQADRDNGVLITVFLQNRKMRIEVGYGLEGVLPDALVNDIRLNLVNPHFQRGQYFQGLNLAVDGIVAAVDGEYQALRQSKRVPRQRRGGGGGGGGELRPRVGVIRGDGTLIDGRNSTLVIVGGRVQSLPTGPELGEGIIRSSALKWVPYSRKV
ncbi:MAG: TPM domain-containing protein, partial [Candidatus Marinimicrobia bacterium]|nr:TPM domain-containing protein [Candidatus Neomarinimicrobiota bacterium]